MIKPESIAKLEAAGLLVSIGEQSDDTRLRFSVAKPISANGNFHPKVEYWTWDDSDNEVELNAPVLNVFIGDGKFEVVLAEYAPGPGPSDFTKTHTQEKDLISFLLDYYFNSNNKLFSLWYEQCEVTHRYE